jgi:hypothetical protein
MRESSAPLSAHLQEWSWEEISRTVQPEESKEDKILLAAPGSGKTTRLH